MSRVLEGEILGPSSQEERAALKLGFWSSLSRALRRVPFAEDVLAAYYCVLDPKTPSQVRVVLLGALASFVLPVGSVPRLLSRVIGYTDRLSLAGLAIATVSTHITPAHRAAAKRTLSGV